jgi:hypothetical protein
VLTPIDMGPDRWMRVLRALARGKRSTDTVWMRRLRAALVRAAKTV